METYLIYIAKAAIAAGAFYIAFLLLFQNQKHFTFNRIYLPVSLALSFVIPLITFTTIKYIEPVTIPDSGSFAYLPATADIPQQPDFVFEWYHYLFGLYLLGVVGFLFHLLLGHLKAINIIKKSRIQKIFNNLVNITQKDVHPFSFFSKIVVSEKTLTHPDLEMIVSHENIHVREKHTLDILFTEVLFLLQWFNPFAWLLKDAVKNNLEYLTDNEIAKHYNPQTYQLAMVTLADKQGIAPFLTALNGSQLKNRIVMMKKKTENKFAIVKQLAVLPILAILVMGLSNKEVKTEIVQTNQTVSASKNRFIHVVKPHNSIKGKVTDQITGSPVADARIMMEDLKIEATTDINGFYEIEFGKNEKPLLMAVSAKKYYTNEVVYYGTNDNLNITVERVTANSAIERETKVTGKVTNEKGEPLSGANVLVKGTTSGTITDSKGDFEIIVENGTPALIISKAGYDETEVKLEGTYEFKIALRNDGVPHSYEIKFDKNSEPNEIVVVGYGTQKAESSSPGGYSISGGMNGTMQKGSENFTITPSSQNGLTIKSGSDPKNHPLFVVDGAEAKNIEDLNPEEIENIEVLKDKSATAVYGDKGKNGVILITTKTNYMQKEAIKGQVTDEKGEPLVGVSVVDKSKMTGTVTDTKGYYEIRSEGEIETLLFGKDGFEMKDVKTNGRKNIDVKLEVDHKLYIVDGKEYEGKTVEIDAENIERIDVLKGESGFKLYGDKGKNGVVLINTKTKYNSGESEPVIFVNGKESGQTLNNIDPATIETVIVLKGEKANKKYGEKGKNGVIEITLKNDELKNETYLSLRKSIAQNIKYPVAAQENNQQGVVDIWAFIEKDGTISNISDKRLEGKIINIDEVVVTSYKSEKTVTSEKSKDLALLIKESKRVIEQLSPLNIPELAGETVSFRIRFVLQ
ncbi:MAG: carboxypeptidase-like regulatory domain-containing protein [Draconibacterium sp.]